MTLSARQIVFNAPEQAALVPLQIDADDLGTHDVVIKTIASLVSPGTEGASFQGLLMPSSKERTYPDRPGYANVGSAVTSGIESGFAIGDREFSMASHASHARLDTRTSLVVHVPEGLAPILPSSPVSPWFRCRHCAPPPRGWATRPPW